MVWLRKLLLTLFLAPVLAVFSCQLIYAQSLTPAAQSPQGSIGASTLQPAPGGLQPQGQAVLGASSISSLQDIYSSSGLKVETLAGQTSTGPSPQLQPAAKSPLISWPVVGWLTGALAALVVAVKLFSANRGGNMFTR